MKRHEKNQMFYAKSCYVGIILMYSIINCAATAHGGRGDRHSVQGT